MGKGAYNGGSTIIRAGIGYIKEPKKSYPPIKPTSKPLKLSPGFFVNICIEAEFLFPELLDSNSSLLHPPSNMVGLTNEIKRYKSIGTWAKNKPQYNDWKAKYSKKIAKPVKIIKEELNYKSNLKKSFLRKIKELNNLKNQPTIVKAKKLASNKETLLLKRIIKFHIIENNPTASLECGGRFNKKNPIEWAKAHPQFQHYYNLIIKKMNS